MKKRIAIGLWAACAVSTLLWFAGMDPRDTVRIAFAIASAVLILEGRNLIKSWAKSKIDGSTESEA